MKNKVLKNKVLVVVSGGVVQNIFSSVKNLKIDVLDFDNLELLDNNDAKQELKKRSRNLKEIAF